MSKQFVMLIVAGVAAGIITHYVTMKWMKM